MTSIIAIDRNKVPEKVIARSIVCLLLKQDKAETQFPKIVTSKKKATIRQIFTIKTFSIYLLYSLEYMIQKVTKCINIALWQ